MKTIHDRRKSLYETSEPTISDRDSLIEELGIRSVGFAQGGGFLALVPESYVVRLTEFRGWRITYRIVGKASA